MLVMLLVGALPEIMPTSSAPFVTAWLLVSALPPVNTGCGLSVLTESDTRWGETEFVASSGV